MRSRLLLLAAAWLLLFRAPLRSLVVMATPGAWVQGLALVVGLVVLARGHTAIDVPRRRWLPLGLAAFAAIAHVVNARTTQIELASGGLFVVGAWALLGLWLPPRRWAQSLPIAIAGLCALPIGAALDLWVGFPLRMATAQLTHTLLAPWLGGSLATETIIVLDGHAGVQVDLPCSGVRSLFTGAIFWAAASVIERRTIGARWLAASIAFVAILVATNFTRVVVLVLLHMLAPPLLCDALHLPLGVVAFVSACGLGWLLLRCVPRSASAEELAPPRPLRLAPVIACVLALAAIPSAESTSREPASLVLHDLSAQPIAATEAESRLFHARGADAVGKWDVAHGRARAQLVIVRSRSWRAQHRPDVCHRAAGRRIDDERSWMVAPGFPVRVARLSGERGDAWAVYWFQSADEITEDHGARVWSALDGDAESWAMVSLVIGAEVALEDRDVVALLQRTREEVDAIVRATEEQ
ncbi:MAG TPA: exosortase O [Nannocystaceae bacterium]|nr:exosortase O [Nannocystaceae bacterium]